MEQSIEGIDLQIKELQGKKAHIIEVQKQEKIWAAKKINVRDDSIKVQAETKEKAFGKARRVWHEILLEDPGMDKYEISIEETKNDNTD